MSCVATACDAAPPGPVHAALVVDAAFAAAPTVLAAAVA